MAKHVIIEAYSFGNTTNTVNVTGKNLRPEQLLLITDVTTGTVIYNFSDPSLGYISITNNVNTNTALETSNIVLKYNCSALSSTDKISIMYDESYDEIKPYETLRDPVDKLRVSNPQALIDTDFEYGIQPTKWESISLCNNRPSAFYDPTAGLSGTATVGSFYNASGSYTISNVTSSTRTVTLAINNTAGITVGLPIFIDGTLDPGNCDGWWLVESVAANTNIVFTVTNAPTMVGGTLFDATKTYLYIGGYYTGAAIPAGVSAITLSGTVGTVTTTNAHGLRPGNGIYVVGTTGATGLLNSSWIVATTPTNSTFTFACTATGTITTVSNASIYTRPLGYVQQRAWDGGVQFTNVQPYHGYQVMRQTRRYFRYQSGKGIQFSTGSSFKPALFVNTLTSSGTTVTVTTKYAHGLLPGAVIQVSGCNETAYNGNFTVVTAATPTTLTYTALSTPSATPATGFPIYVSPYSWYGSVNRCGMYDTQNGFFYEFDGQTLWAVRRNSVRQGAGSVLVTSASPSVVGTGTQFSQQFKPGDNIVLRGQTYQVQTITSDTQMYIYPEYRGTTSTNCVISKTIDYRVAQSDWNIDKCNGTGASNFNLDLVRMQMFYMDYTWYGAGAIRFGFKNNRGEVIYCHRMPNNNVNYEAYLRSGNLPARYETSTVSPYPTYLTVTLSSAATTGASITVADTTGWPNAGTVVLYTAAATGAAIEYITYTSKTTTTLVIGARAQTGGTVATTFTVTGATTGNPGGTAPIRAELYSPQNASTLSHWGSSIIMDGRFDTDKSFVFNFGQNTPQIFATQGTRYPVFSIRLAPSVDNGLTGLLGAREILNRMQIVPVSTGVYATTAAVRVELILNGRVSTGTYAPVGGSSLTQYAAHGNTATITGGESVFTFFAPAGGVSTQDLSAVRDLGTSILSGGTSNTVPNSPLNLFPDGPDILTLCVTPLASNANVAARISWAESQA